MCFAQHYLCNPPKAVPTRRRNAAQGDTFPKNSGSDRGLGRAGGKWESGAAETVFAYAPSCCFLFSAALARMQAK